MAASAQVKGPVGKKPGDSWVDAQGNLWIVSTTGQAVNLGQQFSNLLPAYTGPAMVQDEQGRPTGAFVNPPTAPPIRLRSLRTSRPCSGRCPDATERR